MTQRPDQPKDRFAVHPYYRGKDRPDSWIIQRHYYSWWHKFGQYLEKTSDRWVGQVVYEDVDAALAERDRLNATLETE